MLAKHSPCFPFYFCFSHIEQFFKLQFYVIFHFISRDTASETVRTLLTYGYILDPPSSEALEGNSQYFLSYLLNYE